MVFRFWDDDPLIDSLLPEAFRAETSDGLASMVLENGGTYDNFTVHITEDVTEQEYHALRDWAESLPFEVDYDTYDTIWRTKEDIGYQLNDQGGIEIVLCERDD